MSRVYHRDHSSEQPVKVYFNPLYDSLGLLIPGVEFILTVSFVPCIKTPRKINLDEQLSYVALETGTEFTDDWYYIGDL